jgi:predicted butyrate kinase (DUF1464 family)
VEVAKEGASSFICLKLGGSKIKRTMEAAAAAAAAAGGGDLSSSMQEMAMRQQQVTRLSEVRCVERDKVMR